MDLLSDVAPAIPSIPSWVAARPDGPLLVDHPALALRVSKLSCKERLRFKASQCGVGHLICSMHVRSHAALPFITRWDHYAKPAVIQLVVKRVVSRITGVPFDQLDVELLPLSETAQEAVVLAPFASNDDLVIEELWGDALSAFNVPWKQDVIHAPVWLDSIAISSALLLEEHCLSTADLALLEPGGVLIWQSMSQLAALLGSSEVEASCVVLIGRTSKAHGRWPAVIDSAMLVGDSQMTIEQPQIATGHEPSASLHETDAGPKDYKDIEVRVALVIDGPPIPIGHLPKLFVGQVINLDRPISDPELRVVVEGSTIARGRLVRVGDAIGVLIEKVKVDS